MDMEKWLAYYVLSSWVMLPSASVWLAKSFFGGLVSTVLFIPGIFAQLMTVGELGNGNFLTELWKVTKSNVFHLPWLAVQVPWILFRRNRDDPTRWSF